MKTAAALALAVVATTAQAQDVSGFIGRWQVDPARTHMNRNGPNAENILRSKTFTFVFAREGRNLRMDVYADWPQATPSRTMRVVTDARVQPCGTGASCMTAGGNPREQSYAWRAIDDRMMTRLFWIKGTLYDVSTMALSADSKTMTLISWAPETPQWQNIQVFEHQP